MCQVIRLHTACMHPVVHYPHAAPFLPLPLPCVQKVGGREFYIVLEGSATVQEEREVGANTAAPTPLSPRHAPLPPCGPPAAGAARLMPPVSLPRGAISPVLCVR
jgi:hypothetical protein